MAIAKASAASGVESPTKPKIRSDRRGKSKLTYPPKKCAYCKGLFIPFQRHQKFCCEDHQKLYWKYGTLPFEKLARKLESRLLAMIAAELAPLRARLDALEAALERYARTAWVTRTESNDPEAGEPANIDWDEIDRNRRIAKEREELYAKRGGGAAA